MQEWFDKEYSAKEVYARLYRRSRKYMPMLIVGVVSGMLVGGTWFPVFQVLQPIIYAMQSSDGSGDGGGGGKNEEVKIKNEELRIENEELRIKNEELGVTPSSSEEEMDKLPDWFKSIDRVAQKLGISIIKQDGKLNVRFFVIVIIGVPFLLAFRLLMLYLNGYTLEWVGMHVVRDVKNEMFNHLQNQSLAFFGRMDVGRIMSRCNGDPGTVQSVISRTVADACRAPFEVAVPVGFVIYFAIKNHMLEVIFLALIGYVVVMFPLLYIGKKLRKYARQGMERGAVLGSNMLENLTGIRVVKAYHTEEEEKQKYHATNQWCVQIGLKSLRVGIVVSPMMELVTITMSIVFLFFCYLRGKTIAEIVPLFLPFIVAYKPLKTLGGIQSSIESARAALTRIFSFLDTDTSLPLAANPVRKSTFDKELRFDRVSFEYNKGDRRVVHNASFALERGKTVAVVGSTGSGKTTLANLLARFYDPTEGAVSLDGVDLRALDIGDLRKMIGVVTQETILFNTTIAENIAYGTPGATPEHIENAAKMANAHPFIIKDAAGYQRIVGDKGFVLSGGERQRVAIARAILKNPPILILDEATSALDTVTEQQVQEALTTLMQNRTVFVIAHRLSTVRNADTILVMEHGKIIERGTHDELYAKGGTYRNLCDVQKTMK